MHVYLSGLSLTSMHNDYYIEICVFTLVVSVLQACIITIT